MWPVLLHPPYTSRQCQGDPDTWSKGRGLDVAMCDSVWGERVGSKVATVSVQRGPPGVLLAEVGRGPEWTMGQ